MSVIPEVMVEPTPTATASGSDLGVASLRSLVWRRFKRHRLAVVGLVVTILLYVVVAFCEFLAPHGRDTYVARNSYAPPQGIHVSFTSSPHLFVYGLKTGVNETTYERQFSPDHAHKVPLRFFASGDHYRLWGLIPSDIHLLGPSHHGDRWYPLGADQQGRDLLSRLFYATRISMLVGLIGVAFSLVLGIVIGGISGYFGGRTDTFIQRFIEFVMSIPALPLWLGLGAAVPASWGPLKTYFAITIILSFLGWTQLARMIRGRFLQLRSEDYVLAAELDGASRSRVIFRHMLPSFTSHIIATVTLAIPSMILGETALSFLGLGLQAPVVSWGVLLSDASNLRVLSGAPWLLLPGLGVVVAVLALNFVGDGLRDAADPYGS